NMSYFDCPTCQTSHYIFGKSKTKEIAEKYNVKILGQIPLSQKIRDKLENEGVAYVVEEYREPIRNIANEILSAKPRKAGFLQRISEKITDVIRESVLTSILQILKIANKSVPVSNLMNQFGFPGGRLIRLNLMDQDMKEAVGTLHLRIKDGVIKIVRDIGGSQPDVIVDIYYKALAWAMLKRKPTEDGEVAYDFWSALWNDELRVYGGERSHEQMRSWYVLSAVLENVRQYAPEEIENLMKVFA
ncbi:MAG: P-loop NTPase, partial [Candidatus Caldarchaeum sp.]